MYIREAINVMAYLSFYLSRYPNPSEKNITIHDINRTVSNSLSQEEARIKVKGVRQIWNTLQHVS